MWPVSFFFFCFFLKQLLFTLFVQFLQVTSYPGGARVANPPSGPNNNIHTQYEAKNKEDRILIYTKRMHYYNCYFPFIPYLSSKVFNTKHKGFWSGCCCFTIFLYTVDIHKETDNTLTLYRETKTQKNEIQNHKEHTQKETWGQA